jgi:hypothetical protein
MIHSDYSTPQGCPRNHSAIVLSAEAQNMEVKTAWFNLIITNLFAGNDHEDPHTFLETIYYMVATMGLEEARLEDAYMKIFHLALIGDTKEWFKTIPSQSLRTRAEV